MDLAASSSSRSDRGDGKVIRIICREGEHVDFSRTLLRLYTRHFDGMEECKVDAEAEILLKILDLCQLNNWKFFLQDNSSNCSYSPDTLVELLLVAEKLFFMQIHEATFNWCLHPHLIKKCLYYAVDKEYVNVVILIIGHFKAQDWHFLDKNEDPENALFTRSQIRDLFTMRTGKPFPSGSPSTIKTYPRAEDENPCHLDPHSDFDFRLILPIRASEDFPDGKVTLHVDRKLMQRSSEVFKSKVTDNMEEFDCSDLIEPIKYLQPYLQLFTNLIYPLSNYSLQIQQIESVYPLCVALDFKNREYYLARQMATFVKIEQFAAMEVAGKKRFIELLQTLIDTRSVCTLVTFLSAPNGFVWLEENEMGEQVVAGDGPIFTLDHARRILMIMEKEPCK